MAAKTRIFLHEPKELRLDFHRFQGLSADAQGRYRKGSANGIGETLAICRLLTITAKMDTKENDFLIPFFCKVLHFAADT